MLKYWCLHAPTHVRKRFHAAHPIPFVDEDTEAILYAQVLELPDVPDEVLCDDELDIVFDEPAPPAPPQSGRRGAAGVGGELAAGAGAGASLDMCGLVTAPPV